jgi:hypothetical protein
MSLFEKALEVTDRAFDETADAVEEWNNHRHAAKLFLKLGIAVYAEQRLGGTHAPVDRVLGALDGHAAEHGSVDLDHLRAAHQVLGDDFIAAHEIADEPAEAPAAS